MIIPGEAIIRPVYGNYSALCLLTESAILYRGPGIYGVKGSVCVCVCVCVKSTFLWAISCLIDSMPLRRRPFGITTLNRDYRVVQ